MSTVAVKIADAWVVVSKICAWSAAPSDQTCIWLDGEHFYVNKPFTEVTNIINGALTDGYWKPPEDLQ